MHLGKDDREEIAKAEKEAYLKEAKEKAQQRGQRAGKYHGEHWLIVFFKQLIFDRD